MLFICEGTTWTQNIVYQMKSLECKDYFHPDINFFDSPYTLEKDKNDEEICKLVEKREKLLDELDALPSPRMIKSHLMAFLLPKQICTVQPKMIYLSRDVKDTALSLYHMMTIMNYVGESAHDFFTSFRDDIVAYGPFYEHIGSFTQLRHLKHLLFLTYEELSANPFECVKKVNNFLECDYSDTQLQQLVEHVSFEKMKGKFGLIANSNFEYVFSLHYSYSIYLLAFFAYRFCRKGKVGGYKEVE